VLIYYGGVCGGNFVSKNWKNGRIARDTKQNETVDDPKTATRNPPQNFYKKYLF